VARPAALYIWRGPAHGDRSEVRTDTVHALTALAEGGNSRYAGINPLLNAIVVMAIFLILLFLVTRLDRDK
jgi:hypothetical protein